MNKTHAKILGGYLFLAVVFSFFLLTNHSSEQQLTGYVIFEGGAKVSTEKMDLALVQEIQSGNNQPKIVVVLKEDAQTSSENLGERQEAIQDSQQQVLNDLKKEVEVTLPEEQTLIATTEGTASEEEVQKEIQEDKLPNAQELVQQESSGFEVTQQYDTINALAGQVRDPQALIELANNEQVEKIMLDYPVSVSLDQSTVQINASSVWPLSIEGRPLDGFGETVCVIDTGIDYTHPALGGCNPSYYQLSGTPEDLDSVIESDHPYSDNFDHTWKITQENYTHIAVHFSYIRLEALPENGDTLDRVYVYDQYNRTLAIYKGGSDQVWTPSGEGDTLYVRLVSDGSVANDGFVIDQTLDGITNMSMDWSNCFKVIGGWDAYNNDGDPKDDHGHGTHVAGIIASNDSFYRGVAPGAKLVAVKALNAGGSGYSSDVVAGIDWCNRNAQKYGISVISMSLGCDGYRCPHYQDNCYDDLTAQAVNQAYQQNISVFIAAGNSGWTNGISNPACVPHAIPVGGVDESDAIRYNRGILLKLLAPGTNIQSTVLNGGWNSFSGTSMATPHAAGAAAIVQQYWKAAYGSSASSDQIQAQLFHRGKNIYDSGSGLNFSRLDVYNTIYPRISLTTNDPTNGSYLNHNSVYFEISSELPLVSARLGLISANDTFFFNLSKEQEKYSITTSLSSGNYTYYITGTDLLGLNASTESRTFIINHNETTSDNNESSVPIILSVKINSPKNNSYHAQNVTLNITLPETNLTSFSYLLADSHQTLINYSQNDSLSGDVIEEWDLPEEEYQLRVQAVDLLGENYSQEVNFGVDKTSPLIQLENHSYGEEREIIANVSELHLNESSVVIHLNLSNNLTDNLMNQVEQGWSYNLTSLPENIIVYYQVSARDLAGNSYYTPILNLTKDALNTTFNESAENRSSSSLTYEISSPLNGSVIEAGNFTLYNSSISSSNVTYYWDFGEGTFSNHSQGNKQYNLTGEYNITLNVSYTNQSFILQNHIKVNDTTGPVLRNIQYSPNIQLEKDKTQLVTVTAFDFSGISSMKLYLNNNLNLVTSQSNQTYWWNLTGLTTGNNTLRIEILDNYSVKHSSNFTYPFNVTSCSDSLKNGDETEIDCGGSCKNCTLNITSAEITAPSPIIIEKKVEAPQKVEAPLTVTSAPAEPVQATQKAQPVNWTTDIKESKITRQEKALYFIGGIIIALLSLYAVLLWKNE